MVVKKQKRREHKRMKLETSGVRLGMSSYYGSGDWSTCPRPAEIGRCEKHLALLTTTEFQLSLGFIVYRFAHLHIFFIFLFIFLLYLQFIFDLQF